MTTLIENQLKIMTEWYKKTQLKLFREQEKLLKISNFLNNLYEPIYEHYIDVMENNDKTTIIQAKAEAELKLITKILDEIDTY